MKQYTPSQKLFFVEEVTKSGKSVTSVCKEACISRKTFYFWLHIYRESKKNRISGFSSRCPQGRKHWKALDWRKELAVLRVAFKNPKASCSQVVSLLSRSGGKPIVSHHGVQKILEKHNLNKLEERLAFSKKPFWSRLSPGQRREMVDLSKNGQKIAQICRSFGISRKAFYKWQKRFETAGEGEEFLAFEDQFRRGKAHHKALTAAQERTVLDLVFANPSFGVHKIYEVMPAAEGKKIIGHHGIQNILARQHLNTFERRLAWVESQGREFAPTFVPKPAYFIPLKLLRLLLAPFQTVPKNFVANPYLWPLFAPFLVLFVYLFQLEYLIKPQFIFPIVALTFGLFFFLYSMKYYISLILILVFPGNQNQPDEAKKGFFGKVLDTLASPKQTSVGLISDLGHVRIEERPFVSIHIPFYNEKNVAERILTAVTSMDYPNYEVIIADDSTDDTTKVCQKFVDKFDFVKLSHRESRTGFKGAALSKALKVTDPRAKYVLVFDADFVPYPDTIEQFLKYYKLEEQRARKAGEISKVAAVQGYQWHVLNKSENWVTRGVRTEYAGSYVIERAGIEYYGGLKMIAGSVFCIKRDILEKFGWGTSITEDFQLTLRLYEAGYKILYTPYIQTPSECVSTVKRLIRQRMRWAEGHTYNVRRMWGRLFKSNDMNAREKFEFLYLGPYYLQAAFFLIGTFAWLIAELVLRVKLPFWTAVWGWSLVFANFFSLPLLNIVGLFLEESEDKDYFGIGSFVLLSYLVVPFQAYAATKALFESEEGTWFRTPKSGRITDVIARSNFYKWFEKLPFGKKEAYVGVNVESHPLLSPNLSSFRNLSGPTFKPRRIRFVGRAVLAFFIIFALSVNYLTFFTPGVKASGTTPKFEQQINILDAQKSYNTDTSYFPTATGASTSNSFGLINWDATAYSDVTDVRFEAIIRNESRIGQYNSVVIGSAGYPVIAYYDGVGKDLKVALCNDANCSGGDETVVLVDSSTNDVGQYPDITYYSSGATHPAAYHISYYDNTDKNLLYAYCLVSNGCESTGDWTLVCISGKAGCLDATDKQIGQYSQIEIMINYSDVGGDTPGYYPSIVAYDETNTDLYYFNCRTNDCDSIETPLCIDGSSSGCVANNNITAGQYTGIAYDDSQQYLYVAYYASSNSGDPKMAVCDWTGAQTNCTETSDWSANIISNGVAGDNSENWGLYPSVTFDSSNYPVVSFQNYTDFDLMLAHCGDAACAGSNETINTVDSGTVTVPWTQVVMNGNNPTIAYLAPPQLSLTFSLWIASCNDANCSGGDETFSSYYGNSINQSNQVSMVEDASGYPVVTFSPGTGGANNTNLTGDLMLLHCGDSACAGNNDPINAPDLTSGSGVTTYTTTAGLFPDDSTTAVTSSTVSTSNREYTRMRTTSSILANLTDDEDYTVRIMTDNTSGKAYISAARLIIVQSSTTMITKTQTHVELGMVASTTSTSFGTPTDHIIFYYNTSNYTPNAADATFNVYFEASIYNNNSANTASAQLYQCTSSSNCSTSGTAITNSIVTCDGTTPGSGCDGAYVRVRTGSDISGDLTTGNYYAVQIKTSAGTALIANAKMIIEQADATNGITELETYQDYNTYNTGPLQSPNYFTLNAFENQFDPANFTSADNIILYPAATTKTGNASFTSNIQLYDKTNQSVFSYSNAGSGSTTYIYVTGIIALTEPSSAANLAPQVQVPENTSGSMQAGSHTNYKLRVYISNLPVPEKALLLIPIAIFIPYIIRKRFEIRERVLRIFAKFSLKVRCAFQ